MMRYFVDPTFMVEIQRKQHRLGKKTGEYEPRETNPLIQSETNLLDVVPNNV